MLQPKLVLRVVLIGFAAVAFLTRVAKLMTRDLAYIDYVGAIGMSRRPLDDDELRDIGKFTRENVLRWMESHKSPDWVGICPVQDLHAVCGDTEIPWDTEEAEQLFERVYLKRQG